MARYVMANRRAGHFTRSSKQRARASLDQAFTQVLEGSVKVLSDDAGKRSADERRVVVFDANPIEVESKRAALGPDVILEPEILHWPVLHGPADFRDLALGPLAAGPPALGTGRTLEVRVQGSGRPLEGAETIVFFRGAPGREARRSGHTDSQGRIAFEHDAFWTPSALVVAPAGDHWTMVVRGPAATVTVDCPPLPAGTGSEWWHLETGSAPLDAGTHVAVGVVDSGCGPHPSLAHVVDLGSFIDGSYEARGLDSGSHGTHVNGIIGARPSSNAGFRGIAPGVALHSVRVFPPGRGASQADIVLAIELLSRDRQVDLINLSLGSDQPSEIARDAIIDAMERGTLCIAAAGNSGGPVLYPAGFAEVAAVSALGLLGWGPPGSMASLRVPEASDRFGACNLYLANFSCFGAAIDCTAPGVGIISTVPARFGLAAPHAVMDGTSMACPVATGALAARLSEMAEYRGQRRDVSRSALATRILREICRDRSLARLYQGAGVPWSQPAP